MQQTVFNEISLVLVAVAAVSLVMRLLRQPLIMGYILTGVIVGPSVLNFIQAKDAFNSFSQLGITLLLFIIGLGLNTTIIKRMGRVVLIASIVQILLTGLIGYGIAALFGFSTTEALVIGTALTFSSTIIIIKLINDKGEHTRLYAQISVGILLLQDIVATFALVFLSAAKDGNVSLNSLLLLSIKGLLLGLGLVLVSGYILPRVSKLIAQSQEFLFLFALAWGLGIASLFEISGFSIEVGALFAGVSLASMPYAQEISARLKPLRDFFVVVFFIALGGGLQLNNFLGAILPAIVFSLIAIIVKPFIVLATMGILGYTKRTSFKTAISLSQISEFSLVFVLLAVSTNLVGSSVGALITLVALITIAVSTYLMKYDDEIFNKLEDHLRLFERKVIKAEKRSAQTFPLVLFGYQRGGHEFVKTFRDMHKRFAVVDYNPEVIETLERQGIHYVYGDATDLELLEEIGIERSKLVVSTITDFATNVSLAQHLKKVNPKVVFICHADNYEETSELYALGVSYVMMPHMIGSERISGFIKRHGASQEAFDNYRQRHIVMIGRKALDN